MEIRLANPTWRWVFLISMVLAATTLALLGAKNALAEHWAQSAQPEDWLRAARWEPGNADHWYRLGRYRQVDFEHADLPLAVSYYRRALAIDPRSAPYWMDLASAYEMQGDFAQARQAFEGAKTAYPISSEVAWRYGNFLLRQDHLPEAFTEIRRSVAADPKLAGPAISRCLRASGDMQRILDQILPAQVDVYAEALSFLVVEREMDAAVGIWEGLVKLRPSFEMRRALPLLDRLIEQDRIEQAKHVWQQALALSGWSSSGTPGASLVWDGGFERDFVNGGFGWRQLPIPGAPLEFDTAIAHSGARSLRVTFDGSTNIDFAHLRQFVPVEPQTHYRLAAYLRTHEISTNSGLRFWVVDPRRERDLSAFTPNMVDSHPWTLQQMEFTTGPETRMVEIVLRRLPSQKFDNKIRGTVWVDDVSLIAVTQTGEQRSP